MRSLRTVFSSLLALLLLAGVSVSQTVFFDFENAPPNDYPNTWGSFGPGTLSSGFQPFCENDGSICRWHLAIYEDFLDPSFFGTVNVSPVVDLTGIGGYQIDIRIVPETNEPVPVPLRPQLGNGVLPAFTGDAPIELGLELEFGNSESEVYATPVMLTDTFQTITVDFADFLPAGADLNGVQFKLRMLSNDAEGNPINDGSLFIEYDNVIGLPAIEIAGDYNEDGFIDAADYTVWRDNEGSSVTPGSGADGDGDGDIDIDDYNVWTANFGRNAIGLVSNLPVSSVAVPEPSNVFMAFIAGALGFVTRRKAS